MNVFIIQTFIILLLAFIIFYLITYNSALKLEKRISKYSIDSIRDDSVSLFDLSGHHTDYSMVALYNKKFPLTPSTKYFIQMVRSLQ